MAGTILIIIVVAIVGLLIFAAGKPNTFRYERSRTINAPADKIYPYIADFHKWSAWSPFEKLDPNLKRTYGGSESGLGATYEYIGNSKAGHGQMEITEAVPPSKVVTDLVFIKPFPAKYKAEFTLVPDGEGTKVTWSMYGPNSYMNKVMGTVVNMDRMIGSQFDEGLANLRDVAER